MAKCFLCGAFVNTRRFYCSVPCREKARKSRQAKFFDTVVNNPRKALDEVRTKLPETTREENFAKRMEERYFFIETYGTKTEYNFPIKLSYEEAQLVNDLMKQLGIDKTRIFRVALRMLHKSTIPEEKPGSPQEQCQAGLPC